MMDSYVGIISRRGLECFVPETEHTARFLVKRAKRSTPSLCYWAVMHQAHATEIKRLLASDNSAEALRILNAAAQSLGSILPSAECDEPG